MANLFYNIIRSFPIVVTIHVCLLINLASSSQDFGISTVCQGNPTSNPSYRNNVVSLLSLLASETSVDQQTPLPSFLNTTVGDVPNRAYGLYNCRGDLDSQVCHDCVVNVTQALSKQNVTYECFGFDDQCMIHYADSPIYSVYRRGLVLAFGGRGLPVLNYEEYNKTLSIAMEGLIREAAVGNWTRSNFETKVVEVSGTNEKIYTLVQCTPDLSPLNCSRCLEDLYSYTPKCCRDAPGGNVIHANCMLKYDNQSFFGGDVRSERNDAYLNFIPSCLHVYLVMLLSIIFLYI